MSHDLGKRREVVVDGVDLAAVTLVEPLPPSRARAVRISQPLGSRPQQWWKLVAVPRKEREGA